MGVADDGPRRVEGFDAAFVALQLRRGEGGCLLLPGVRAATRHAEACQHQDRADHQPNAHLISALISAGGSKTAGETLSLDRLDSDELLTPMRLFFRGGDRVAELVVRLDGRAGDLPIGVSRVAMRPAFAGLHVIELEVFEAFFRSSRIL